MFLDVDKYLSKRFHLQHYNCWHFVRDVWYELSGVMLYDYTPDRVTKYEMQLAAEDASHRFMRIETPGTSPLIVLMKRNRDVPHIGVLYNGKVLHLRPEGAVYQPMDIASTGFDQIIFYTTLSHP